MSKCIKKTYPKYNGAIIFKTNDISWHGLPENIFIKSIAYYYNSPLSTKSNDYKFGNDGSGYRSGYRSKATFIKRQNDEYNEKIEQLYKIIPHRRITSKDMNNILPDWKVNSNTECDEGMKYTIL